MPLNNYKYCYLESLNKIYVKEKRLQKKKTHMICG